MPTTPIEIKIGVRELVEQVLRSGDLDATFHGTRRSLEAIRAHQRLQSTRPPTYAAEVRVSHQVAADDFCLTIDGRIDGVDRRPEGVTVEEIKTTAVDAETFASEGFEAAIHPLHRAQAEVYAFLYARQEDLAKVEVRLAYVHLDTGQVREFSRLHRFEDLASFFDAVVQKYLQWARVLADWKQLRDRSIEALAFPFRDFRAGQREMAVAVYRSVKEGRQLMVQAPTGIGKSMAALFAAVKAMPQGGGGRIFYLTARTTGKAAAEQALAEMQDGGLRLKSITLTAKERICFQQQVDCTPEACPFAKGHFDRVNDAVSDLFGRDNWNRQAVETAATVHRVCPFELSLDLCMWAECIICDLNYAFDPRVYLRRFFQEDVDADHIFLIDEAHNLVDRARDMFSSDMTKSAVLAVRREIRGQLPAVYRSLTRINSWLLDARRRLEAFEDWRADTQAPEDIYPLLEHFVRLTDGWLRRDEKTEYREALLQLYFSATGFLRIAELFNAAYTTCYRRSDEDLQVRLFCLDPSLNLEQALQRCRSAIFFSATLTPIDYFRQILGCPSAEAMVLPSPFPRENFGLFLADRVSTLYRHRRLSAAAVLEAIDELVSARSGNYLLFFPSYAYMQQIHEAFQATCPTVETIVQQVGMGERSREEFLSRFSDANSTTLVGFAVMGGVFGEGIDLVGERLCGAAVVGVGLPGISPERELIRRHFADKQGLGFEFAYQFPGINRVLQAAGRVIRSESDRGAVLLIDRRFSSPRYRSLLPAHWQPLRVDAARTLRAALQRFWNTAGVKEAPG